MSFCRIEQGDIENEATFNEVAAILGEGFPEAPLVLSYVGAKTEKDAPRMALAAKKEPQDVKREALRAVIHVALGMAVLFNDLYDAEEQVSPHPPEAQKLTTDQLAVMLLLDAASRLSKNLGREAGE